LLPSGVLQCRGKCIIANGVVVNPKAFIKEIEQIEAKVTKQTTFLSVEERM
jgi:adenylosuccinate synthase